MSRKLKCGCVVLADTLMLLPSLKEKHVLGK